MANELQTMEDWGDMEDMMDSEMTKVVKEMSWMAGGRRVRRRVRRIVMMMRVMMMMRLKMKLWKNSYALLTVVTTTLYSRTRYIPTKL